MARPAKWASPTTAIRIPEKYALYLEALSRVLEEVEGFVQNPDLPFSVGDRVLLRFRYPDDYQVVEVLEVDRESIRPSFANFYFQHPQEDQKCRWSWYPGSGVVPIHPGESLESAICRSIIACSLEPLLRTEFRVKNARLETLLPPDEPHQDA